MCFLADVVRRRPLISSPGSVPRPGNGKSWGWAGSGTSSPGTGAAVPLSWHRPGTQIAHSRPRPVICASPALLCLTNAPGQQQRAESSGWCCRARGRRGNLGFCSFSREEPGGYGALCTGFVLQVRAWERGGYPTCVIQGSFAQPSFPRACTESGLQGMVPQPLGLVLSLCCKPDTSTPFTTVPFTGACFCPLLHRPICLGTE